MSEEQDRKLLRKGIREGLHMAAKIVPNTGFGGLHAVRQKILKMRRDYVEVR